MRDRLTFGDGFMFGCGFFTASIVATIVFAILLAVLSLVLGLLGAAVTIPFLQGL